MRNYRKFECGCEARAFAATKENAKVRRVGGLTFDDHDVWEVTW